MSEKVYKVKFKNLRTGEWENGREYKSDDILCNDLNMTKPTMRKLINKGKGIYSKFIKISVKDI